MYPQTKKSIIINIYFLYKLLLNIIINDNFFENNAANIVALD